MAVRNRRNFLKLSGLSVLPAVLPATGLFAAEKNNHFPPVDEPIVRFGGDGEMFEPGAYLEILKQVNATAAIGRDSYGNGGAVGALEKKF